MTETVTSGLKRRGLETDTPDPLFLPFDGDEQLPYCLPVIAGVVQSVFISQPKVHLFTMELIDIEDLLVARLSNKGEIDVLGKIRIEL